MSCVAKRVVFILNLNVNCFDVCRVKNKCVLLDFYSSHASASECAI